MVLPAIALSAHQQCAGDRILTPWPFPFVESTEGVSKRQQIERQAMFLKGNRSGNSELPEIDSGRVPIATGAVVGDQRHGLVTDGERSPESGV